MATGRLLARARSAAAAIAVLGSLLTLPGCFAPPPQIVSVHPDRSGSNGVGADTPVTVIFDQPVAASTVAARFSVNPGLPGCNPVSAFSAADTAPCYVHWLANQPGFTFYHPRAIFAPNITYTFKIAGGVQGASGATNSLDHQWTVRSASAPTVAATVPLDQATGVPIDSLPSIDFSEPMDPVSTAASVILDPPIAGTQVVPNHSDPSRFVLDLGGLMRPNAKYTLQVGPAARDAHGQALEAPTQISFTTGGLSTGRHLVVASAQGSRASVDLVTTAAQTPGDPSQSVPLDLGPAAGDAVSDVALNSDGRLLAVQSSRGGLPSVRVYAVTTMNLLYDIPGASMPIWDGTGPPTNLAYAVGQAVAALDTSTGVTRTVGVGENIGSKPAWLTNGELAVAVTSASGAETILLVDPGLGATYPVVGLPSATAPIGTPGFGPTAAAELEFVAFRLGGGGVVLARPADSAPTVSGSQVAPIGFLSANSVLARPTGPDGGVLEEVSLTGGAAVPLSGGPRDGEAASAVVAHDGRQIAWIGPDYRSVMTCNNDGTNTQTVASYGTGTRVIAVAYGA